MSIPTMYMQTHPLTTPEPAAQNLFSDKTTAGSLEKSHNTEFSLLLKRTAPHGGIRRILYAWILILLFITGGNTISSILELPEMIVNLDENNCPLLIDQPEDDLDNRSIYNELVQYLRKKKHERQIIVVTHNANVVIGADAEEVIIANQNGDGARNYSNRFEYRCGAIENISPIYDEAGEVLSGILNQKGIQEQICDILEGGREALTCVGENI